MFDQFRSLFESSRVWAVTDAVGVACYVICFAFLKWFRVAARMPVAYAEILKGTGHCTEGRMLIGGRWAPQIGNWLIRRFWHAELHSKVSGARVGRVLIYVCVKCGHTSPLRRLDGRTKANATGHALNARMLGTPLSHTVGNDRHSIVKMTSSKGTNSYIIRMRLFMHKSCNLQMII